MPQGAGTRAVPAQSDPGGRLIYFFGRTYGHEPAGNGGHEASGHGSSHRSDGSKAGTFADWALPPLHIHYPAHFFNLINRSCSQAEMRRMMGFAGPGVGVASAVPSTRQTPPAVAANATKNASTPHAATLTGVRSQTKAPDSARGGGGGGGGGGGVGGAELFNDLDDMLFGGAKNKAAPAEKKKAAPVAAFVATPASTPAQMPKKSKPDPVAAGDDDAIIVDFGATAAAPTPQEQDKGSADGAEGDDDWGDFGGEAPTADAAPGGDWDDFDDGVVKAQTYAADAGASKVEAKATVGTKGDDWGDFEDGEDGAGAISNTVANAVPSPAGPTKNEAPVTTIETETPISKSETVTDAGGFPAEPRDSEALNLDAMMASAFVASVAAIENPDLLKPKSLQDLKKTTPQKVKPKVKPKPSPAASGSGPDIPPEMLEMMGLASDGGDAATAAGPVASQQSRAKTNEADDDDWGDFGDDGASMNPAPTPAVASIPADVSGEDDDWGDFDDDGPAAAPQPKKSMKKTTQSAEKKKKSNKPKGGLVGLMDLFSTAGPAAAAKPKKPSDNVFFGEAEAHPKAAAAPSKKRDISAFFGAASPLKSKLPAATPPAATAATDDDWGDFDDDNSAGIAADGTISAASAGKTTDTTVRGEDGDDDWGDFDDDQDASGGKPDAVVESVESETVKPETVGSGAEAGGGADGDDWGAFDEADKTDETKKKSGEGNGEASGDEAEIRMAAAMSQNFDDTDSDDEIPTDGKIAPEGDAEKDAEKDAEEKDDGIDLGEFGQAFLSKMGAIQGANISFTPEQPAEKPPQPQEKAAGGEQEGEAASPSKPAEDPTSDGRSPADARETSLSPAPAADAYPVGLFDDMLGTEAMEVDPSEMPRASHLRERTRSLMSIHLDDTDALAPADGTPAAEKKSESPKNSNNNNSAVQLDAFLSSPQPQTSSPTRKGSIGIDILFAETLGAASPAPVTAGDSKGIPGLDAVGDEDPYEIQLSAIPAGEETAPDLIEALAMLLRQQRLRDAVQVRRYLDRKSQATALKRQASADSEPGQDDAEAAGRAAELQSQAKAIEDELSETDVQAWMAPFRTPEEYKMSKQERYNDLLAYARASNCAEEFEEKFKNSAIGPGHQLDPSDTKGILAALEAHSEARDFVAKTGILLYPPIPPRVDKWVRASKFVLRNVLECRDFIESITPAIDALASLEDGKEAAVKEMHATVAPAVRYLGGLSEMVRVASRVDAAIETYRLGRAGGGVAKTNCASAVAAWEDFLKQNFGDRGLMKSFFDSVDVDAQVDAEKIKKRAQNLGQGAVCQFCCLPLDAEGGQSDGIRTAVAERDGCLYHATCLNLQARCCV